MSTRQGIKAGRAFVSIGTDDSDLVRGLRGARRRLLSFAASLKTVAIAAAATAAAVGATVKVYADFEQQMANVSTMVDDVGAHMDRFKKQIREMSVAFGASTATLSDGLYQILSAQVPASEAMEVLRASTTAATAGMTDVETASRAIIRVMRAYGKSASDAAGISDLMFKVVKEGIITFESLAENIGKVAPTAKAAGLSMSEMAGAMVTVLASEEPERAMTALRQAIFEAAEAGVDLMEFAREFRGKDLGAVIKAGIPKRAAQGVVILANSYDDLSRNIASMENRAGSTEVAFGKMTKTITFQLKRLKQASMLFMSKMGEVFSAGTKKTLPVLVDAVLYAANTIPPYISKIVRAFSAAFSILNENSSITSKIFTRFAENTRDAFNAIQKIIIGALKAVSFAIKEWSRIAKAAVLAVLVGFVKMFNDISLYLGWFEENWHKIFSDALELVITFVKGVGKNFTNLVVAIKDWGKTGVWLFDSSPLLGEFEPTVDPLPDAAKRKLGAVEKELKDELDKTMGDLGDAWRVQEDRFTDAIKDMSDAIQAAARAAEAANEDVFSGLERVYHAAGAGGTRGTFMATELMSLVAPRASVEKEMAEGIKKVAENTANIDEGQKETNKYLREAQLTFTL